jgi:adenine-specific DNA-methyltransferase
MAITTAVPAGPPEHEPPGPGEPADVPGASAPPAAAGASLRGPAEDPLEHLAPGELRMLVRQLQRKQRLGLYWERKEIEHERAVNASEVVTSLVPEAATGAGPWRDVIIEGDNFDALRLLRLTHGGRVDVICIDPPYNTGKSDFVYNDHWAQRSDRFRQSQWLEHLYRRMVLARDLLANEGVLLVFINDENRARLELLLDDVFHNMRVGSFVWRTRQGSNDITGARFSMDHEHVLIFARPGFAFAGLLKTLLDYVHDDGDGRGPWASKDLSAGVSWNDPRAGNAYYPLHNPATDTYYPCNPNRVWAYVTREQAGERANFKSRSMDDLIEQGRIKWPDAEDRVEVWHTLDALLDAIDRGDVPRDGKGVPLLRRGLPNLEALVGRRVGFGRPRLKRYRREIDNDRQPVSSWIRPKAARDAEDRDEVVEMTAAYGEEGGQILQAMFGEKVFNYPKPLSLVTELLRQAAGPDAVVLDFYAGAGTTGHAVMALNAEDRAAGRPAGRRFILVSSTEATEQEPERNLCRDVCARRIRLAAEGFGDTPGLGGGAAYLRVHPVQPADAAYEITPEQVWNTLSLLHGDALMPYPARPANIMARDGMTAVLFVPRVTGPVLAALATLPEHTLRVYSDRPAAVEEALQAAGKDVVSLSALEAVLTTQAHAGAEAAFEGLVTVSARDAESDAESEALPGEEVPA